MDNPLHIAFLLVVALLVFGAKRLPEMGRSLGTGMRGFKEALNPDFSTAVAEPPAGAAVREDAVLEAGAAAAHQTVRSPERVQHP